MRKTTLTLALAGSLALGGCASYGNGGLLGDLLGGIGGDDYGYNGGNDFERAAVRACGREAERYNGRVTIYSARQQDRDYVFVSGRIETRDSRNDEFTCVFRQDGRVVDFQTR